MIHSLLMFLAPETTPAQATPVSPPAAARPLRSSPGRGRASLRFAAEVAAGALGFAVLFAGCWILLLLLQALL